MSRPPISQDIAEEEPPQQAAGLGSHPYPATHLPWDLGRTHQHLWAKVASATKWILKKKNPCSVPCSPTLGRELSSGKDHESESHPVMSNCLWPHRLYSPWNSPGQNTGVSSLSLLQGIFPTQGLNPGLPHCRWIFFFFFLPTEPQRKPKNTGVGNLSLLQRIFLT